MCELLGISSNRESNIQFSSQVMQANSREHPSGWGVAFYPEESSHARIFKEPIPMKDSALLRYLHTEGTIRSRLILNHIRKAAGGREKFNNTHPFTRELFGQDWTLIHNGASGMDRYFERYFGQVGGSEKGSVPESAR